VPHHFEPNGVVDPGPRFILSVFMNLIVRDIRRQTNRQGRNRAGFRCKSKNSGPSSTDSKGIRHPVEEREKRDHVNGFRDLGFGPALISQDLSVIGRHFRGFERQLSRIFQQDRFRSREFRARGFEISGGQGFDQYRVGFLRPQESGMRVRSVAAMVQGRNERREHFFDAICQMPIPKMDTIGKSDDITEEIRPVRETFEDIRNDSSTGIGREPFGVSGCSIAFCRSFLNETKMSRSGHGDTVSQVGS
jgi:hypothetical protein